MQKRVKRPVQGKKIRRLLGVVENIGIRSVTGIDVYYRNGYRRRKCCEIHQKSYFGCDVCLRLLFIMLVDKFYVFYACSFAPKK